MRYFFWFGLVFLTLSLQAAENPPEKRPATQPAPVEVIGGNKLDLGKMYANELRYFAYRLKNTSTKPLKYTRVYMNCSCSKLELKLPGLIEPGQELIVPVELDAQKISEKSNFQKALRIDFEGYRELFLYFNGTMSEEIQILGQKNGKEKPAHMVSAGFIESVKQDWNQSLEIKANFTNGRKLVFGEAQLADASSHQCTLLQVNENHWRLQISPKLPQKLGKIDNMIILPMLAPNQESSLRIPIEGMVGTRIEASIDQLHWDPEKDPRQTTKTFALTRMPFDDRALRLTMFFGRANPYEGKIKILKPEEVILPQVPGIYFELAQGKGGVLVHCHIQGDKLQQDGIEGFFEVDNSLGAKVRFFVLNEAERKKLQKMQEELKALDALNQNLKN